VLVTAHDAHMRDYGLYVPEDCVAAGTPEASARALTILCDNLGAETVASTGLELSVDHVGRAD